MSEEETQGSGSEGKRSKGKLEGMEGGETVIRIDPLKRKKIKSTFWRFLVVCSKKKNRLSSHQHLILRPVCDEKIIF